MSDRTAKLTIETEFKADPLKKGVQEATGAVEKLGDAGATAAADLSKTAASADELARSDEKLTETASEAAGAIERVGAAGASSLPPIAAEAGSAAAGVAELGERAAEAGRQTEDGLDRAGASVKGVTALYREQAAAIEALPLSEQLAEYRALEGVLTDGGLALKKMGDLGAGATEALSAVVTDLRGRIASVTAELEKEGAAIRDIQRVTVSAANAEEIAVKQINAAYKSYGESLQITQADIRKVAQAVEAYSIANDRNENTLRSLRAELALLNDEANRQINAQRDNAVAFQETGNRVAGLGLAVQDLTRSLGPAGAAVGNAAASVGILAANYEQAKDAAHGLDLNTLQLNKANLAAGVQWAAIVAAVGASVDAGLRLAKQNSANREEVDGLVKSVKQFVAVDLASRVNATTQEFFQLFTASKSLTGSFVDATLAIRGGAEAVTFYNALVRDGVDINEAYALALDETVGAAKFYADVLATGSDGQKVWNKVVAESKKLHGDIATAITNHRNELAALVEFQKLSREEAAKIIPLDEKSAAVIRAGLSVIRARTDEAEKYDLILRINAASLREYADRVEGVSREERERLRLIAELATKGRDLDATQKLTLKTLIDNALAAKSLGGALAQLAEINSRTTAATSETNTKLRDQLALGTSLAGSWARNSIVLRELGTDMGALVAKARDVVAVDRERLTIIAELLSRAPSLTASQQQLTADLLAQAAAGTKATAEMNELARIHANLDMATNGTTEKLTTELNVLKILATDGWDRNSVAIGQTIAKIGELAGKTDDLDARQRKLFETMAEGQSKIDGLKTTIKGLEERYTELLLLGDRRTKDQQTELEKTDELIILKGRQIDITQRTTTALIDQAKAGGAVVTSNAAIIGGYKDGVKTITNVASEYGELTGVIGETAKAAAQAAESQGRVALVFEDGKKVIKQVGDATSDLTTVTSSAADSTDDLWDAASRAAAEGRGFDTAVSSAKDSTEKFKDGTADAAAVVKQLEDNIKSLTATMGLYKIAAEDAANAGLGARLTPSAPPP